MSAKKKNQKTIDKKQVIQKKFKVPETAIIIIVATIARLIFLTFEKNSPLYLYPIVDELEFFNEAKQLVESGFSYPFYYWHPPVYLWFLGLLIKFGFGTYTIVLFQMLLGIASTLLLYLTLKEINQKIAFFSALIWALWPMQLYLETRLLSENISGFMGILLLFLLTRKKQNIYLFIAGGLIAGLIIGTKSQFLIFIILFAVFLYFKERRLASISAFVICSLIFPFIFSVHNYRTTQHKVLSVSANGPVNLYIGNSENLKSTLNIRPYGWNTFYVGNLYKKAGIVPDSSGRQIYLVNHILVERTINANKNFITPVKNILQKTGIFLSSEETPRNINYYRSKKWNPYLGLFLHRGIFFPLCIFFYAALLFIILKFRKISSDRTQFILLIYLISVSIPSILIFNASRYRLAIVPLLIFWGLWFYSEFKSNRKIIALSLAGVLIFGTKVSGLFLVQKIPDAETYASWADGFFEKKDYQSASEWYQAAIDSFQTLPDSVIDKSTIYYNAGNCFAALGMYENAKSSYESSVKLNPENPVGWDNLGNSYLMLNQPENAIEAYTKALELAQEPSFFLNKAICQQMMKDTIDGKETLKQGLVKFPSSADLWYSLGLMQVKTGEKEAGCNSLQNALKFGHEKAESKIEKYCRQ